MERKVERVSDAEELVDTLWGIGMFKNELSLKLRWYINELGLYVQLRYAGKWERLAAGGKLRSYFDAWRCFPDGNWDIKSFDKQTWEHRFAHLVAPTSDVAQCVSMLEEERGFNEIDGAALIVVFKHFKVTGEWPSQLLWVCANCGKFLGAWQLWGLCPHCACSHGHEVVAKQFKQRFGGLPAPN